MSMGSTLGRLFSFRWLRTRASLTAAWEHRFHEGMIGFQEGRMADAERAYEAALDEADAFPPGDPRLTATLSTLARVYCLQGKYDLAEPLCRRALAIKEKTLGPAHSDVAATLKDLVDILRAQGKTEEAEPLYRRALAILERAIGPEFSELAESIARSLDPPA